MAPWPALGRSQDKGATVPQSITAAEMPEFKRVVTTAKWAGLSAFVADWCKNHAKGDAFKCDAEDGIDSAAWGGAGQAIRVAGKSAGVKFNLRFMYADGITPEQITKANAASPKVPLAGTLYAQHDGEYVNRPPRTADNPTGPAPAKGAAKK